MLDKTEVKPSGPGAFLAITTPISLTFSNSNGFSKKQLSTSEKFQEVGITKSWTGTPGLDKFVPESFPSFKLNPTPHQWSNIDTMNVIPPIFYFDGIVKETWILITIADPIVSSFLYQVILSQIFQIKNTLFTILPLIGLGHREQPAFCNDFNFINPLLIKTQLNKMKKKYIYK